MIYTESVTRIERDGRGYLATIERRPVCVARWFGAQTRRAVYRGPGRWYACLTGVRASLSTEWLLREALARYRMREILG